jgi:hypothetical protein
MHPQLRKLDRVLDMCKRVENFFIDRGLSCRNSFCEKDKDDESESETYIHIFGESARLRLELWMSFEHIAQKVDCSICVVLEPDGSHIVLTYNAEKREFNLTDLGEDDHPLCKQVVALLSPQVTLREREARTLTEEQVWPAIQAFITFLKLEISNNPLPLATASTP